MKQWLWLKGWMGRVLLALMVAAGVAWVAAQVAAGPERPQAMAALLPQGALLSIESPDFGSLLHDWERSPEQAAWTKSDNFGAFEKSRLFSRLAEAQEQFAGAAGLAPDRTFLDEVAGTDSIFAWYDIGKLEFLYITKLPAGKAEQTRLVQAKSSFSPRQVGTARFYVRTRAGDQGGEPRTVAFAVSGNYLLLATREDLMAGALGLIAHPSGDSLATEPWFVAAGKAAATDAQAPALRMALDLERIVKTPYFRSYWLPQNVTEMRQYRAALVDLYREPSQMREERVLLPKTFEDAGAGQGELGDLVALVPPQAGVYRALATGDASLAVAALDEKLLGRGMTPYAEEQSAPDEDLSERATGSASDLETRIDAPPAVAPKPQEQMKLLRAQLAAAGVEGVLTVDSNEAEPEDGGGATMWVPFHAGVAIRAARAWDRGAIETALADALEPQLSAGSLGLAWQSQTGGYASLGAVRPLEVAVRGNVLLVADDAAILQAMLARVKPGARSVQAMEVGGFNHQAAAGPFLKVATLLDRQDTGAAKRVQDGSPPGFFSGDVGGLSQTFSAMRSERLLERRDGPVVRQTVTYVWK